MRRLALLLLFASTLCAQEQLIIVQSGGAPPPVIPPIPATAHGFTNQERGSTGNGGPTPDSNGASWIPETATAGAGSGTCTLSFGDNAGYSTPYGTLDVTITPAAANQYTNCLIHRRLQTSSGAYPSNQAQLARNWAGYKFIIPTATCGKINAIEKDGDLWTSVQQLFASYQFDSSIPEQATKTAVRFWFGGSGTPYGSWTQKDSNGATIPKYTSNIVQQCEQVHQVDYYNTYTQSTNTYCYQDLVIDGTTIYRDLNNCYSGYTDTTQRKIGVQFQVDLGPESLSGVGYKFRVFNIYEYWDAAPSGPITPVSVSMAPTSATVTGGSTQQFTATVTGSTNTAVTWSISPSVGSVSSSGLYTAGAATGSAQTVTVTATSAADGTKSASATVTIPATTIVAVSPSTSTVAQYQHAAFTPSVTGNSNTAVTWSRSPAVGTIDSTGHYYAPRASSTSQTITVTATSVGNPTKSASSTVTIPALTTGAAYFLSPTGLDSNSGTSTGSPWLTPNHAVNCGDTITAAAGNYTFSNFNSGKWGTVTCSAGNNVAWLQCATFDACKISAGTGFGIYVDKSYWGVQGWEVTTSASGFNCFSAGPNFSTPLSIHHVIFANNVANGCGGGGVSTFNNTSNGVDYIAFVANIAYNAAQYSTNCASGMSIFQPVHFDTVAGTHLYMAGNFSFKNLSPNPCAGATSNGGDGLIFDTFDGTQTSGDNFQGQAVAENNISVANGGHGMQIQNNGQLSDGLTHALALIRSNTFWGNVNDPNSSSSFCDELGINTGQNTQMYNNLVQAITSTACGGNTLYAFQSYQGATNDLIHDNWLIAAAGSFAATAFFPTSPAPTIGTNTNSSPSYASPAAPPAPSCGSSANVPACMSTVISNFTATASGASANGKQPISLLGTYEPEFPQWVCNTNLPAGLVTMGCSTTP